MSKGSKGLCSPLESRRVFLGGQAPGAAPSQKPTKTQGGTSEDSSTHSFIAPLPWHHLEERKKEETEPEKLGVA